ncbi:hypothetical protein [Sinomonas gamaensis]|uniref:hypothetical protein n=1 Tax=Sinomonas gamaensis TaxID=2565624 RepID=UPI001486F47C|nr:hypothetical protein [Sinomonas gamaensis]
MQSTCGRRSAKRFWTKFEDYTEENEAIRSAYEFGHKGCEFWSPEDWDVKEYAHQYLVALYGIVDGIARYDAAKTAALPAGLVAAQRYGLPNRPPPLADTRPDSHVHDPTDRGCRSRRHGPKCTYGCSHDRSLIARTPVYRILFGGA